MLQVALVRVALARFAPERFAPVRFARVRLALPNWTPLKSPLLRYAPVRLAPFRVALVIVVFARLAPLRMALVKFTWAKVLLARYALVRLTPVRLVAGAKDIAGKNAVGPSRYPAIIFQFAGRLAGVPVLPHDETLVNVAVPSLVPVRFVPAMVAPLRLAPLRSVDVRFVRMKFVSLRFVFCKLKERKSAPVRLTVGPTSVVPMSFQSGGNALGMPITSRAETPLSVAVDKSALLRLVL